MADFVGLSEALASVGFRCIGLPWSTDSNPKMETDRADEDRPRIQVIDYVYKSPTLPHTTLVDSSPIIVSGVWMFKQSINIHLNMFLFDFYFDSNALTRSCNYVFALTKYAVNPTSFTDAGSLPQLG